jgi:hypothetical protein
LLAKKWGSLPPIGVITTTCLKKIQPTINPDILKNIYKR